MYKLKKNFLCAGILDYLLNAILNHTSNVILGFIPRIHAKQNSNRHYRACPDNLDPRDKPEDDHKRSLIKGLDVLCQCAALFERRVQSGTRVRKAQAVTRQTNECIETAESGVDKVVSSCEKNPNVHKTYMNFLRQRKTALDAPLHAVSSGRSMIEMLGVLAIIGVLSVGGIAGYSKAMMQFKINKTKQQIAEVVFNIRSMYAQQNPKDYSSLYVDSLPEDFGKAFGGYAVFNSVPNGILEPDRFSISLFGLPMEACVALATTNWGTDKTTGFVGMSILSASAGYGYIYVGCKGEGEGSYNAFYYACSGSLPLSPSVASKYCARSPDGSIYLSFH